MKKLLLCLAVAGASVANAQQFEVVDLQQVKTGMTKVYHPRFMPDGKTLLVTSEDYNGLGLVDIEKQSYTKLTDMQGAGYYPVISADGKTILTRSMNQENFTQTLYAMDVETKGLTIIAKDIDHVNQIALNNGEAAYATKGAIVGTAVGYALSGGRALVELMYADFIGCAGDEIFNQMSKWQAMSAGILKMPLVLRVSVGSKYGAQHSQDWTALCAHIPGLKVVFPATPWEAKGLMETALKGTDPVVFFESQRIYDVGEQFHEGGVPAERYEIEIGDTNKVRDGKDITILTIGAALYRAMDAAKTLSEKYGMEADVINIHSLSPLDYTKILESVRKTGKVVLVSDACARGSFLNDVAKTITDLCFDDLDAPPVVVGAKNWITPPFEFDAYFFPQDTWILDAIHQQIQPLAGYEPGQDFSEAEKVRAAKLGV